MALHLIIATFQTQATSCGGICQCLGPAPQIRSRKLKEQQRCDWHMELLALPSAPGHLLFFTLSLKIKFEGLVCAAKLTFRVSFKGYVFI